jgi:hypothetical protein
MTTKYQGMNKMWLDRVEDDGFHSKQNTPVGLAVAMRACTVVYL